MRPIGDDGGIRVAEETTWNTAGSSFAWQHAVSSSLGVRKDLIRSSRLQRTRPPLGYGVGYADGEIVVEYDKTLAVIGTLLKLFGAAGTGNLTIDGTAPDVASATIGVDHGGLEYQYTGCVGSTLRFELTPDQAVQMTVGVLGGSGASETASTPSAPAEAGIVFPSDLGVVTVGAAALNVLQATIECAWDVQGSDRKGLGGDAILQPVQRNMRVTGTLQVELSNDTGDDTAAQIADYLAGTALGDVSLDGGDFLLASCYMTGDMPSLQSGVQTFPINIDAESLLLDDLS